MWKRFLKYLGGVVGVGTLWVLACVVPITPPVNPTPVADGGVGDVPHDMFSGLVADCSLLEVSSEMSAVDTPVAVCLSISQDKDGCLLDLLTSWTPPVVACEVRSLGMEAWAVPFSVRTDIQRSEAINSQSWIRSHNISFQDN